MEPRCVCRHLPPPTSERARLLSEAANFRIASNIDTRIARGTKRDWEPVSETIIGQYRQHNSAYNIINRIDVRYQAALTADDSWIGPAVWSSLLIVSNLVEIIWKTEDFCAIARSKLKFLVDHMLRRQLLHRTCTMHFPTRLFPYRSHSINTYL